LQALPAPFGLTVRYAVKANPHPTIIGIFHEAGLAFDASSSYEAAALLKQGVPGAAISLSSQQPAHNLSELLEAGVKYVATSMHQLKLFAGTAGHGGRVALRVNAAAGSGYSNGTTTTGMAASFGLWHEYVDEALSFADRHHIIIDRLHTHAGTGSDPAGWGKVIDAALAVAERMPQVVTVDIGGGFKVHRFGNEPETDMVEIVDVLNAKLGAFEQKTGRRLNAEIEPGTWLVAHSGCLIAKIVDIVDTGSNGFTFLRTNTGMNDFLRPALHGAQHAMRVIGSGEGEEDYVVVGHNCESSDVLTTALHDPQTIEARRLAKAAIGDLLVIEDTGAYCASMRLKGYNSYPEAAEVFI
jgi:diaminopimelate decarboxylase